MSADAIAISHDAFVAYVLRENSRFSAFKKETCHGEKGKSRSTRLSNGNTLLDHQGCSECNRLLQTSFQGEGIDVFIRAQRQGRTRRNESRRFSNNAG